MEVELWRGQACRICRVEGKAGADLYYPCHCAGSIKFVHEKCLLKWIEVSKSMRQCAGCQNHVAKCEVCAYMMNFRPIYSSSVLYRMGVVMMDNVSNAFTNDGDWFKIVGDLSQLHNTSTQMFLNIHMSSSSAIWQTIAEFTVAPLGKDHYDTFWQYTGYAVLNFGGAHLLLSIISALYHLHAQVVRDIDRRRCEYRGLPLPRYLDIPPVVFESPTHWGYSLGRLKAVGWVAVIHPFLQRGAMVLGRWFLYRLRCQHALRLLFDQLAVELAQYRFCRWVVSELLRYGPDALEADGVTVEGVLSVLVKACAEAALGWTALVLAHLSAYAFSTCACAATATINSVGDMAHVFVRDFLPTAWKVGVQVLVLLVFLPAALAALLLYELQPYLPALLTDPGHVVPRALLCLLLFCLASKLLRFCDMLAAETYRAAVVPAFPKQTASDTLVQNAHLAWTDLLHTCGVTALVALLFCLVVVVLPLRLILSLLPGPQPVLLVEYLVTVVGAELSWWQVCFSLSVPVLLSAYVVGNEIVSVVPAAIARYLTAQTVCRPPVRPLTPLLNTAVAGCSWWVRAAVAALPVLAGLGALSAALLCVPLLLGRLFLSLLPAPTSEHPLFLYAVGLPLLATLLCCCRTTVTQGGVWYHVAAKSVAKFARVLLQGFLAMAGPGALAGILLGAWAAWLRPEAREVRTYTWAGCALGGLFLASVYVCASIPEPGASLGSAAAEVMQAARMLYARLPALTVLLLDLTVGPLLLARAQRHWEILSPDSLVLCCPFLCWAVVYYVLGKCMLIFGVYREARRRKVVVGYKLMNVDEQHSH